MSTELEWIADARAAVGMAFGFYLGRTTTPTVRPILDALLMLVVLLLAFWTRRVFKRRNAP